MAAKPFHLWPSPWPSRPAVPGSPLRKWLTLLILTLTLAPLARAQDAPPPATPAPTDPAATYPFHVLDQQEVVIGTHTITFNRVVPPTFPAPTPAALAPTAPAPDTKAVTHRTAKGRSPARPPGHRTRSTDSDNEDKPCQLLSVSATVYDHRLTELRWPASDSAAGLRLYVNLDFNYLANVASIETSAVVYQLNLGLGNETADTLPPAGQSLPDLATFPSGHSSWRIVEGDASAYADDLAALAAFCSYYDANKTQLIAAYEQRKAEDAAHEQFLRDHPPAVPDTVINYWPLQSLIYATSSH